MLVAVTNRGDLREVLRAACAATPLHGARAFTFEAVDDIGDVLPLGIDVSLLVLDLAYCSTDPELLTYLPTWRNLNPGCVLVLVRTMSDKEAEGALLFDILRVAGAKPQDRSLSIDKALSITTWIESLLAHPSSTVLQDVRAHFEARLPTDVPNRALLMQMLTSIHTDGRVKDVASKYGCRTATESASTQRGRVNRALKRAGQPVTHEILTGFRFVLNARLLELAQTDRRYWHPNRRAVVMGAANHKALKRSLARCTGFSYEELSTISYEEALAVALALVRAEPRGDTKTAGEMITVVLGVKPKLKVLEDSKMVIRITPSDPPKRVG